MNKKLFCSILAGCFFIAQTCIAQNAVGVFDENSDIGSIKHQGRATYNTGLRQQTIAGLGNNIGQCHNTLLFWGAGWLPGRQSHNPFQTDYDVMVN